MVAEIILQVPQWINSGWVNIGGVSSTVAIIFMVNRNLNNKLDKKANKETVDKSLDFLNEKINSKASDEIMTEINRNLNSLIKRFDKFIDNNQK